MKGNHLLLWKAYRNGMFAGALSVGCAYCLIEDWMGLEQYLAYVRDYWVESPWVAVGSIVGLLMVLLVTTVMRSHFGPEAMTRAYIKKVNDEER